MKSRIVTMTSLFAALFLIFFLVADFTKAQDVKSILKLDQAWSGDFDGMVERHLIRALVPYSKTFYFLDGADQRGLEYELLKEFEKYINKQLKKKKLEGSFARHSHRKG